MSERANSQHYSPSAKGKLELAAKLERPEATAVFRTYHAAYSLPSANRSPRHIDFMVAMGVPQSRRTRTSMPPRHLLVVLVVLALGSRCCLGREWWLRLVSVSGVVITGLSGRHI